MCIRDRYQRADSEPDRPDSEWVPGTGNSRGTYSGSDGWGTVVPSGTEQLWEVEAFFNPAEETQVPTADWSSTFQGGAEGPSGQPGVAAFNASLTTDSPPTFYEQSDGSWPTGETSDYTVSFTDGTTTVEGVYRVTVNSEGVLTGTITTAQADITVTTTPETVTDILNVTWTHISGASTSQEFLAISQGATGETGPAPTVTKTTGVTTCLLYTSPSPRDRQKSRMPSSA